MKLRKAAVTPQFLFFCALSVASVVLAARHNLGSDWWLSVAACLGGVVLFLPISGVVHVRQTIHVKRPLPEVFDFLSQPVNEQLWNHRVGMPSPLHVPARVGESWVYLPASRWIRPRLRYTFSELDPMRLIEITATGGAVWAKWVYLLREIQGRTEITFEATVTRGLPAALAWLTNGIAAIYPSRDLARLQRALEAGPSSNAAGK